MRWFFLLLTVAAGCSVNSPAHQGGDDLFFEVIPFGDVGEDALAAVQTTLAARFGLPVRLRKPLPLPRDSYNASRNQFRAESILRTAYKERTQSALRTIAVCDVDIYAEGLNFVFGIASEAVSCCLVSAARLRDSFYGLRDDPKTFFARMKRLTLHEVGHTFGLPHCKNRCVMVFANSLAELDATYDDYCPKCWAKIKAQLGQK